MKNGHHHNDIIAHGHIKSDTGIKICTNGGPFKFFLKVGVAESIVNAPRITDHGSVV
jgi:hypothetical protein